MKFNIDILTRDYLSMLRVLTLTIRAIVVKVSKQTFDRAIIPPTNNEETFLIDFLKHLLGIPKKS